jgi:hypothetical protein
MKHKPNLKALKISIIDNATEPRLKTIKLYAETDLTALDYTGTYNKETKTITLEHYEPNYHCVFFTQVKPSQIIGVLFGFIDREHEEERKTQDHYKELEDIAKELKEEAKKS